MKFYPVDKRNRYIEMSYTLGPVAVIASSQRLAAGSIRNLSSTETTQANPHLGGQ